ncbi:MAG: bifunctional YncE family protein/alkaline phosphatase family protein, partial [Bryobacteraceae bacterium]
RSAAGTWAETTAPLALGHNGLGVGLNLRPNGAVAINSQVGVTPCAAGVAISSDGQTLVVANYYNDSVTVFTGGLGNWSKLSELDLRPGKSKTDPRPGVAGGEYPFWVVVKGNGPSATAYVSSIRDREIVVVSLSAEPEVKFRIPVTGQPNKMTLNAAQTLLYVAEDQSDTVDVIDTATNAILASIPVIVTAPGMPAWLAQFKGANPNSVAFSPDETQLYVTSGTLNCIAVVALDGPNGGGHVVGLIPTGWYPNSVSLVSFRGPNDINTVHVYVVNAKSPTGANPEWCYGGYGPPNSPNCEPSNQYNPQRTKAGLQSFPLPTPAQLANLTEQVAVNNRFSHTESDEDLAVMAAVRQGVKHVIFIIKENRTYDQILGDLKDTAGHPMGDGDPTLTEFGEAITPNHHSLARNFVTLDNFLCTAEVSYDGWSWSTSAQAPDVVEHQFPVAYAARGLSLDGGGVNRNVNVGLLPPARQLANPFTSADPDVLPGHTDTAAPDGPNNEVNTGYLWNAALRAHLTVRNYGFSVDGTLYGTTAAAIPVLRNPFAANTVVAYPSDVNLAPFTDPYFRGFDNSLPDYWRYTEWARDFDARYAYGHHAGRSAGVLPSLTLVRFMHDHTGNYAAAIDGVNTPDLQVADNDYAVALLVQKIATSPYADNTLIFIIEDDAQDGGDHVDSHRSTTYVVGPYVKRGAVVSTRYTTLNVLRTIEEVLGLPPMNLNDALARPMADIFNTTPSPWSFTAAPSALLYNTSLPLPPKRAGLVVPKPARNAEYWARVTRGMDFTTEDRLPPVEFNRILWKGMMGDQPYPAALARTEPRDGRALKQDAAREPKADRD